MRLFPITMFIENFHPHIGGAEMQLQCLCKQLSAQGVEVGVLTLRKNRLWPKRETVDGFEVVRLPYPQWRFWGSLVIIVRLLGLLLQNFRCLRILHVQGVGPSGAAAVFAARLLGKDAYLSLMGSEESYLSWTTRAPAKFLFWLLRRATAVIAISHEIGNYLLQQGFAPDKIRFIPYGVDTKKFFPRQNPGSRTHPHVSPWAVFTGRLVKEKGLQYLLRAWRRVVEDFPRAELLIIGDGPLRAELGQQCREIGIQANVCFLGMQPDIPHYLQQADLYISASISEGLSNSILEAMACGLPVIGTKISGTADVICDGMNGLLVDPAKPEDLSRVILRMMRYPRLAKKIGLAAARTIQEKYSIERIAEAMSDLYRKN